MLAGGVVLCELLFVVSEVFACEALPKDGSRSVELNEMDEVTQFDVMYCL